MSEERQDRWERKESVEHKLLFEVGSVDEAMEAASARWDLPRDQLQAEVVGSGRKVLGLFGGKLKVEVRPAGNLLLLRGVSFLNRLFELMDVEADAALTEEDLIEVRGADAADCIVGHYGDVLKSLEYLLNLALRDPCAEPRVRLDSCGYRERRTRSLERLAEATARQAVEYGRPIRLDPMLSWERWVIHMTLKDREDVRTESIGEPPLRKVVVMPKFEVSNMEGSSSRRPRPRPQGRRRY